MILQLIDPTIAARTASIVGVVALAGALATAAAIGYRWYAGQRIQEGLAALVGLAGVAINLNTTTIIGGGAGLFELNAALVNVGTFVLAVGATLVGRRLGDRIAGEASVLLGRREIEADVGRLVSTVGRVVAVKLPETIEDLDGYDPVPEETKAALAGRTLLFPRRLTVAELHDRLRTRLADDHGIGHVDVDLADDGAVEYLAVGQRTAGLGPTLAPGTAAVAVEADPAYAASAGDVVELWREAPERERVAVGELRAAADDVVTVALDEADARALPADETFRLITRPATPQADREFAGLLRAADERLAAVTIGEGSALVGTPLAELDLAVVAVRPAAGSLLAVPPRDRSFAAGDVVYAIGRPDAIRRLEAAA